MIRWYDWFFAGCCAYSMLWSFFSIPMLGALLAFAYWEIWDNIYCPFRKRMEEQ